jgi:hypothetical protein
MGSTLQQTYRLGSERKDNMSSNHRLCLGVRDCTIISYGHFKVRGGR